MSLTSGVSPQLQDALQFENQRKKTEARVSKPQLLSQTKKILNFVGREPILSNKLTAPSSGNLNVYTFYGESPRVQNSGQPNLEVSTYGAERESLLPHSNFSKRSNLVKAENRFQAEVEYSIENQNVEQIRTEYFQQDAEDENGSFVNLGKVCHPQKKSLLTQNYSSKSSEPNIESPICQRPSNLNEVRASKSINEDFYDHDKEFSEVAFVGSQTEIRQTHNPYTVSQQSFKSDRTLKK